MDADLERLQRAELDRALRALEDHLADAAGEVHRLRQKILRAAVPAPPRTYSRAAAQALRAVTTALHNADLGTITTRAADAEEARATTSD